MRAALVLLCCLLAGCVTVESVLRPDGSATLELRYRAAHDATEFLERRRFASPAVHVESLKIEEDGRTLVRATVDDVTLLSGAEFFRFVIVNRERDGDDETVLVRLLRPAGARTERDGRPWLRLAVTLPGPVRAANHDAEVTGRRVSWTVSKREYFAAPETVLRARYRRPAG